MAIKKIGILSDTHIPKAAQDLPQRVYDEFKNVDIILHAGDLIENSVLKKLKRLAPTYAVYGNMDMTEVRTILPAKDIVTINGYRIGLMHGYGPPTKLVELVSKEFNSRTDIIVFGHSHMPYNERINGRLFFNPGSPTDKIFAPYNSFGMIELDRDISSRIIRL